MNVIFLLCLQRSSIVGHRFRSDCNQPSSTMSSSSTTTLKRPQDSGSSDPSKDSVAAKRLKLEDSSRARAEGTAAGLLACSCTRAPRRGWTEAHVVSEPLGAFAFKSPDNYSIRYHCLFTCNLDSSNSAGGDSAGGVLAAALSPAGSSQQQFLGCFATKEEAGRRWDAAVRDAAGKEKDAAGANGKEWQYTEFIRAMKNSYVHGSSSVLRSVVELVLCLSCKIMIWL